MSLIGHLWTWDLSPIRKFQIYLRGRRRKKAWTARRREFVYLDEVSVTSLMAARHGAVVESLKDTVTNTSTSEFGTSVTLAPSAGAPGAGLTTKNTSGKTSASEVLRRSVIQGTFRSLRLGDLDLRISTEDQLDHTLRVTASSVEELRRLLPQFELTRRAVRVASLQRGEAIEARVQLQAERTYQIATAINASLDLIKEKPAIFGIEEDQLSDITAIAGLLSRLLVDLVPLSAPITSHRLVTCAGDEWLVDKAAIRPGSELDAIAEPISLVGVTETSLYWKDVRRILFDESEYTVYARLAKPSLSQDWSSVKLANVLEKVIPGMGEQLRGVASAFDDTRQPSPPVATLDAVDILVKHGLRPFGSALAQQAGRMVAEQDLASTVENAVKSLRQNPEIGDVVSIREMYEAVVRLVEASPPLPLAPIDRDNIRLLREAHQSAVEAILTTAPQPTPELAPPIPPRPLGRFLEVEVTAIYW